MEGLTNVGSYCREPRLEEQLIFQHCFCATVVTRTYADEKNPSAFVTRIILKKILKCASIFYVKNITRNLLDLRGPKSTSISCARCAFFGAWNSQKHAFAACKFCGRVITRAYAGSFKTHVFS